MWNLDEEQTSNALVRSVSKTRKPLLIRSTTHILMAVHTKTFDLIHNWSTALVLRTQCDFVDVAVDRKEETLSVTRTVSPSITGSGIGTRHVVRIGR